MDIVRTFHSNDCAQQITILGTHDEPLFKANDVANILEIQNIRGLMLDWDSSEKVVHVTDTPGGKQKAVFLTESGLYRLIFRSNKPIAEQFRKWVVNVLKEIRLHGKYELPQEFKDRLEKAEERNVELERQLENVSQQLETLNSMDGQPIIYIYDMDIRVPVSNTPRVLKIGVTEHCQKRFKPYRQIAPFGRMVFSVRCKSENLKTTEHWINHLLKPFNQAGEVFHMNLDLAKKWLTHISNMIEIANNLDYVEMESQLSKIIDVENIVLHKTTTIEASTCEISTQTDEIDEIEEDRSTDYQLQEQTTKFERYIQECCLLDLTFEVSSADIVGQYRIWAQSADKDTFHAFVDYLQTKYKQVRLPTTNQTHVVNGFRGLKLKENAVPPLSFGASDHEIFLAHACNFTPSGKVLMADLLAEYEKWCKSVGKTYNKKDIKTYLKDSPRVLVSNVWTTNGNGQGYYGLCLKHQDGKLKITSSTAKCVTKRTLNGDVVSTWTTIAKAAQDEGLPAAKLSRAIKNKTVINNFMYVTK